jgi:hypothetical protein
MGFFNSKPPPRPMRKPLLTATADFRAVEIRSEPGACAAARECVGRRFLSSGSAPPIPMLGCDRKSDCTCRYQHHEDRRAGPRRGVELGKPGSGSWIVADRRNARGRRADD